MDFQQLTGRGENLIGDVRGRLHHVEIRFPFEPLLNDLHVEQSEEAAAEAEAQGVARLRLEFETWIVDVKLRERVAQLLEVLPIRRIETAINHALRWPIAGQGFGRLVAGGRHRVANVNVADRLDIADQITDLPGLKLAARASLRNELAAFEQ